MDTKYFSNSLDENPNIEHWLVSSNHDRRNKQLDLILSLGLSPHAKILDVGGKSYFQFFAGRPETYEMIDLAENSHPKGKSFDGRFLPFDRAAFDVVILSYVLHHASDYSLGLLEQTSRISRKFVVLAEDLVGLEYPTRWLNRCHAHEPGGLFRSQMEWEGIFKVLNLTVLRRIAIRRNDENMDPHFIYRIIWVLRTF